MDTLDRAVCRRLEQRHALWSGSQTGRSNGLKPVLAIRALSALTLQSCCRGTLNGQTVATGVAGEPTAPGSLSGGPVNRKRLRPFARSQSARGLR